MNIEDINGYVTAAYVGKWWVGVVLEKDLIKNEVKIKFLHPSGPLHSFSFPTPQDILVLPTCDILTINITHLQAEFIKLRKKI